jgi:hypothetical protein
VRAEGLLANITPGEWRVWRCEDVFVASDAGDYTVHICDMGEEVAIEDNEVYANAEFIAAAPQLVRDLLALLDAAAQERERLEKELHEAKARGVSVPVSAHGDLPRGSDGSA